MRGDLLEVWPPYEDNGFLIDFFGDTIESIKKVDSLTGEVINTAQELPIFPARHFVTPKDDLEKIIKQIEKEKLPYDKPNIQVIELAADEVLAVGDVLFKRKCYA